MEEAILGPLEHMMTSPWLYAALVGICFLDAVVPVFPSEAPLILAGVYAASDITNAPNVVLVVLASAAGACLGDHMSYFLGKTLGDRLLGGERRAKAVHRVRKILHDRGSWALLVVRFIPGGRSAATLSLGTTHYPLLSKFTPYDLLATVLWAVHGTIIGYVGGATFRDNPLAAMATGIGLAMLIAGFMELWRWRGEKKRRREGNAGDGRKSDRASNEARTGSSHIAA